MLKSIFIASVLIISTSLYAEGLKLSDLSMGKVAAPERGVASTNSPMSQGIFSTKNLAWITMAFLGATGLTAKEQDASSTHIALAGLTALSYGAFLNSYMNNSDYISTEGKESYKWASYSKWLHIPAMMILPVAGALAQRQFHKGDNSATGFAATHKPAALASVIGMSLATLSLTFEF